MEQQINYLSVVQIAPSKMNPRKFFDHDSLEELAKSILEVGILSPMIVRPDADGYEIVCGERRYKAGLIAGLKDFPVIIRELDDDAAMDLMITENLQRQDVSPMEEAEAFKNLIELRNKTIQDLMLRFAKSEKYIRYRIKLNDLIPELKDQLSKDMISLGHAHELCKLDALIQKEILQEFFSEKRRNESWYSLPTVSSIKNTILRNYTLELENAPFSTKDATLDKKAGPCTTCHYNSSTNTLMFPDLPAKGVCLKKTCYKHKSDIDFDRKIKKVIEEEPGTILGYSYAYGDEEKWIKGKIKEGLPIIETTWSTGFEQLDKKEYRSDDPTHVKVLIVTGNEKGRFEYRKRRNNSAGTAEEITVDSQIRELQEKDNRNKELSFEKLYLKAKEILNTNKYSDFNTDLTQAEYAALYVIMLGDANESLRKELFSSESSYIENHKKLPAANRITPEQVVRLTRSFIQSKLANGSPNYNVSESNISIEICNQFFPEEINPIQIELDGKYLNRKKKIEERIAELKGSIPEKKETKKGKKTSQPA